MIPTAFDGKLAEIDDAAGCVMVALRTIQHAGARDVPRLRENLRGHLQSYVDLVMSAIPDTGK